MLEFVLKIILIKTKLKRLMQINMKHNKVHYIKKSLFPCILFSLITGIFTGIVIFLFKISSGLIVKASASVYEVVRKNPQWLVCLILGAAILGLLSATILKHNKNSRGGGIPTSVAILRGLIDFHWLKNIFGLFFSALITFLGAVPLGTEGPSVQMGTAIGRGTIRVFGKNHRAWDRYIMTGGASGGFAVATGAPISGIIFAFEEAHRRFSPLLFMTVAMTVSASTATMKFLCELTNTSSVLFDFSYNRVLPLEYLWISVAIGIICAFLAIAFTQLYSKIGSFINVNLKKLSFTAKTLITFALVGLLGFAAEGFIGSGHELINELVEGHGIWYMLILFFCFRALVLMFANHIGISGGIFVPTLAFGALIGALFSQLTIQTGILPKEYYIIPIIIGMSSFLAASSRTPITSMVFSLEALGGLSNSLAITIGITLAFLIIEILSVPSLQDMVINQKVERFNKGKTSTVVDTFVTVTPESFAQGKEVRNILLPPTCTVLSVKKQQKVSTVHEAGLLESGDILHIHYQSYNIEETQKAIEAIFGNQSENSKTKTHTVDQNTHIVPDL